MSRRIAPFAFLVLLPLGGCKALVREGEAITYQPGTPPTTTVAKCDATYSLDAKHPDTNTKYGWGTFDVLKGATVGFRREPDGSLVAIAGEQIAPIPDERAAWHYTPTPVTRLDRFAVSTRDRCEHAAGLVVLTPLLMLHIACGGEVP